ncbi:LysE family translocator [Lysobacter antibioticus]|uniref:LysE type translocator family protein n=1 Tax=Lysobacter antibioticus TaxID=84531 RepID=A0A0S2F490_LYSAN|nr:LysE family translocator [Lysobacter antibioticus]ALN78352.1 lysE type translocator family protein [Lysobacter antibioticus]
MMLGTFAAFWAVSILFVITPGVDWAYTIAAGMRDRAVPPAVGGLLLGHLAATLIVAAGVGALIASMPIAMTILTVAGSAYLLWLGIGMLMNPPMPGTAEQADAPSAWGWLVKGVCVSGLNPKVFLLFLALLPQFVNPSAAWSVPAQILALGLIHIFSCGVVYLMVGYGSHAVLRTRPQAAKVVGRISGAAMVAIAAFLLLGQFKG